MDVPLKDEGKDSLRNGGCSVTKIQWKHAESVRAI